MSATPQRPGMPVRQSTGRMSQTGSRRSSLTGNPAIDGMPPQSPSIVNQNRRPSIPNAKGHQRQPSGNIGNTPGSRPGSRRGSVTGPGGTINYRYVGMICGRRNYYQDGYTYYVNLLMPNGTTVKKECSDLPSYDSREGDLLFENPVDGKLYNGTDLPPQWSFRFAGKYESQRSFQNEGVGGTVSLIPMRGGPMDEVPFLSDPDRECFKGGQVSKLGKKGDHVWYNTKTTFYYVADWVVKNPGRL